MRWNQLLAQRKVQLHTTSKRELDGLRALIERDLTDAALAGLSADRRFATAYNAALQTAKMVIACAGYRVASTPGHHRLHFEAARIALGSSADRFLDYFEASRRERNIIDVQSAFALALRLEGNKAGGSSVRPIVKPRPSDANATSGMPATQGRRGVSA